MKLILTPELIARLEQPVGGSDATIKVTDDTFIKMAAGPTTGPLSYAAQKLFKELAFRKSLPPNVAEHFPAMYGFKWDLRAGTAELTMERVKHPSLTKAILLDRITPTDAASTTDGILTFATGDLYGDGRKSVSGHDLFARSHASRIARPMDLLPQVPELDPLLSGDTVVVNDLSCPSVTGAVNWLNANAAALFPAPKHILYRIHGDLQPGNTLVRLGDLRFWLCDERGDEDGPAAYDISKFLKVSETGYDVAQHGFSDVSLSQIDGRPHLSITIDDSRRPHYEAITDVLLRWMPTYAEIEGLPLDLWLPGALVSEAVHVLSLLGFYINRPEDKNIPRLMTFTGTFLLLVRRLMAILSGSLDPMEALSQGLPIWGEVA